MKSSTSQHHRIVLTAALTAAISLVGAQPSLPDNSNGDQYNYTKFSPSMAIIVVVLISAFFFMGFFSIYIRHCSDSPAASALSLRGRRTAAGRGLDASVIETFPTFSYSEVKDHKIGKGALECAVCLNEFEENETLRLLPKCDHVFHTECIDAWLGSHVTCPVCRANLDEPVTELARQDDVEGGHPDNGEIVIHVDVDGNGNGNEQSGGSMNGIPSFEYPNRSRSIRRVFGFDKFRSHSTGHSLVQPGQNLDRFTLRLPEGVRKEVMDRAALNRTGSCAATLPRVESSRRGYRTTGGGEESGRGRFYRRIEGLDRGAKSDRWVLFTRGLSMRSPKVVAEGGEGSGSGGGGPVKLPSFKCLEPKAVDETGLISDDRSRNPV